MVGRPKMQALVMQEPLVCLSWASERQVVKRRAQDFRCQCYEDVVAGWVVAQHTVVQVALTKYQIRSLLHKNKNKNTYVVVPLVRVRPGRYVGSMSLVLLRCFFGELSGRNTCQWVGCNFREQRGILVANCAAFCKSVLAASLQANLESVHETFTPYLVIIRGRQMDQRRCCHWRSRFLSRVYREQLGTYPSWSVLEHRLLIEPRDFHPNIQHFASWTLPKKLHLAQQHLRIGG